MNFEINSQLVFISFFLLILNIIFLINFSSLSKIINIFDYPDKKRKIHKKPVSLSGGIIIYYNLIITLLFLFIYDQDLISNFYIFSSKNLFIFIFTSSIIFFVGIYDDKFTLSPSKRVIIISLAIYFLLATDRTLILNELIFSFANFKIQTNSLDFLLTIVCFVSLILALNMFDGINLQSGSFYALFFLFYIVFTKNYFIITIIIPITFILFLNYKNKLFLGDSGSYLLSLLVGFFSIKLYKYNSFIFSDHIFSILYLPILDCARVTVLRIIRGRRVFKPDRTHLQHLLLNKFNYNTTIMIIISLLIFPYLCFMFKINSIFTILITSILYFYLIIKK